MSAFLGRVNINFLVQLQMQYTKILKVKKRNKIAYF